MKKCNTCKIEKPFEDFYKSKHSKDGHQGKCKQCDLLNAKEFKKKNPNYNSTYFKNNKDRFYKWIYDRRDENRDEFNEYMREYRKENLIHIREYQNIWMKNKYNTDINYKLKINVKGRIVFSLKKDNLKKGEKITEYLGCSIENYKIYLEQQFLPEMNWENHGTIWEIDHIIPIAFFDLLIREEQKKCFHYSNTQPLFKTTEIAKSFGYDDHIGNRNKGYK